MSLREQMNVAREGWRLLSLYQRFEHVVVIVLTGLIAIIIVAAMWSLTLKILFGLVAVESFDPTDHAVFQGVFGMVFTVIIALEFKRSLLVVAERRNTIVQVRTVILLALLAILRKFIILDLKTTDAAQIIALATSLLALGGAYWMVRDQDRRDNAAAAAQTARQQQSP
jgi:uncharacterized membrane protein (DUF373 family)